MQAKQLLYKTFGIITGVLFLLDIATYVTLLSLGIFDKLFILVQIACVISLIVLILLCFLCFINFFRNRITSKILRSSNVYSLGMESEYYNRMVFENVVENIRKRKAMKDVKQSLIIFSAVSQNYIGENHKQYSTVNMNGKVIQFLEEYFFKNKTQDRHIYCFDQNNFMIYCIDDSRADIINMVNNINDELYKIVEKNEIHLLVTPYFGIDEFKPKETLIEVIENATIARDVSKNNFETLNFYREGLEQKSTRAETESLIKAIENNEFVIYYQPKFDVVRGRFISSEALIRWNHPELGLLTPDSFVPIAMSSGLTHELDVYVLRKVCEDLRDTKKRGRRLLPVSLNFSLYEFYNPNFLDYFIKIIKEYNVDYRLIQIEILETTSQANPFISVSIIKKLKELGIRVLMDDFGIGYSNLGNLNKIPFDAIKIDKSYIEDIVTDKKSKEIVQCLIDLGRINSLEVIAEGVDSQEQVDILTQMGCDTIQGFYYSCALSKSDYDKFLLTNKFEYKEERR